MAPSSIRCEVSRLPPRGRTPSRPPRSRASGANQRRSVEVAARQQYLDERIPAGMYAAMGDADRAIVWLERGFSSNAAIIAYMNVDNRLAPLRSDPRFQTLVRRAGVR